MEFESTEKFQMIYETLKNIDTAITRLQERTAQIHTVDDFLLSPIGMEKLDAACMVIIGLYAQLLCLQNEKLPLSAEHALEMVSFC